MSAYANDTNTRESLTPSADDGRRIAQQLGIGFDGRYYRYRDYRYDRLSDAINYAKAEQARPGEKPPASRPEWLEPMRPTDAEKQLMAEFGITFDGRSYIYDGYRYDHCKDAASYARQKHARKTGV